MLPDDALLEIFDFYMVEDFEPYDEQRIEEWMTLAHVCRRWRSVVFQSPHRLNLRLLCTPDRPARDSLDIWPSFPLVIYDSYSILWNDSDTSGVDNIIAALEHNDRVCQIQLGSLSSPEFKYFTNSAAMQKPFPELTHLGLGGFGLKSILPDSLLGGTAPPRLRSLNLSNVPFPGLPKLLLSATHLVNLDLYDIPRSGYIPPEVMATSLSALASLKSLRLHFQYPQPRTVLESRCPRPRPSTRSVLLSLTKILFKGASEYLEEILTQIDAPRLDQMRITFFNHIIFDTPQLSQFISRRPTLRAPEKGQIGFNSKAIVFKFPSQTSDYVLDVQPPYTASGWQPLSLERVCTSSLPPLSTLEDLYVVEDPYLRPRWQDDVENTLWLDLLRSFVAVKNLYLSEEYVPRIASALQELVGGRMTEVLPALEKIFLAGFQPFEPLHEGIQKFVAARRLTHHPVAVSRWDRDSKQERLRDL